MVNAPLFTILNQMRTVSGIPFRVTASETWYYVLVEAQGMDEATDAARFEAWLEEQAETGLVTDAAASRSLADVKAFWGVRDACAEFLQVLGPHEAFNIGLPVAAMDDYVVAWPHSIVP